jgi:hypothetical protein
MLKIGASTTSGVVSKNIKATDVVNDFSSSSIYASITINVDQNDNQSTPDYQAWESYAKLRNVT